MDIIDVVGEFSSVFLGHFNLPLISNEKQDYKNINRAYFCVLLNEKVKKTNKNI